MKLTVLGIVLVAIATLPSAAQVRVGGATNAVAQTGASLDQTSGNLNGSLTGEVNTGALNGVGQAANAAGETTKTAAQRSEATADKSAHKTKRAAKHAKGMSEAAVDQATDTTNTKAAAVRDSGDAGSNADVTTSLSVSAGATQGSNSARAESRTNANVSKSGTSLGTSASGGVNPQK